MPTAFQVGAMTSIARVVRMNRRYLDQTHRSTVIDRRYSIGLA